MKFPSIVDMKLQGKQLGIFIALILAFIMLFLPSTDKSKYSFNPDLLAKSIIESEDQISPQDLSEWIIEGRNDYQLIDIRTEEEFGKGNIKSSDNIPLSKLLNVKTIEQDLNNDKTIILYSNGNSHAHQAWLILKSAGKDAYVLEGGFNNWNRKILNPELPQDPTDDEILRYKASASIAEYFGGTSSSVLDTAGVNSGKKKKRIRRKKKKLEGC